MCIDYEDALMLQACGGKNRQVFAIFTIYHLPPHIAIIDLDLSALQSIPLSRNAQCWREEGPWDLICHDLAVLNTFGCIESSGGFGHENKLYPSHTYRTGHSSFVVG